MRSLEGIVFVLGAPDLLTAVSIEFPALYQKHQAAHDA
jgi:hypothetical protein